jgi:hypothetical protein
MIDWVSLEQTLFRLTEVDLREFARKHARETFYGFAFDCNSEYGEVGLCLNTTGLLKVQRAAPNPNAAFFASLDKKLGFKASPAATSRKTRWDLGDWHYQGFNSKAFDRGWRRFQTAVIKRCTVEEEDEGTFMTPSQSRFMEAACRILIRLERGGSFDVLKRTANFGTLAMDHEESASEARARLRRIRRATGGA